MENRLIYKERFELRDTISAKEKQLQAVSGKSSDIVREDDVQRRVDQVYAKIDRSPVSTENKTVIGERFAHLVSLRAARIREIDNSAGEVLKKMYGDIKTELDEFLKQNDVFELATRIEQSIDRQSKIDKEIKDREAEIAKIDEKLKDLSERQRRITDETLPTLYARLNKYTEENSVWTFLDEEKIIEQTVRLIEAGERVLEKLSQEMAKVAIRKIQLTQEIYLLKYHQQQGLGKNTDALLLEIYDEMGQASPAQLKDQIEEAKQRAIESPNADNFNRLLYQGKYQEALVVLNERNRELTRAIGARFSEYDVLRFYEGWKGHPPYRADEFLEGTYGYKLLQEGFTSVPLQGSQMGRLMVKENADGSLSYVVVTVGGYAITMARGYRMKQIAKERREALAQEYKKLEGDVRKVLSENPNLHNVQQASIVVQRKLSPLFAMFKAGQQGKKTPDFILLAKRYASDIRNSTEIANLRNNAQKARADLEMLKKFGVGAEDEFEKEINQYQKALDRVIDTVENDQLIRICDQILRDDYTEDDLKSWFVKDGLIMLTAILTATAAVVITISTCGIGGIAALALVAAVGSAGGIVGAELGHLASEEVGRIVYGETFQNKSFLGKYLSEEEILDPETGQYRQITLAQLGKVYGEQFVMGFVTTFAILGLGKLAGAALSKFTIANRLNAGASGVLARLVLKLPKMSPQKLDLLEAKGLKKVLGKIGSEFLEELGEEGLESAASKADAKLGFLVSVYNCLSGGQVELSLGEIAVVAESNEHVVSEGDVRIISNFSYDSSTGVDVEGLVRKKYEAEGFEIEVRDGEIVCVKKMVAKDGTKYSNVMKFKAKQKLKSAPKSAPSEARQIAASVSEGLDEDVPLISKEHDLPALFEKFKPMIAGHVGDSQEAIRAAWENFIKRVEEVRRIYGKSFADVLLDFEAVLSKMDGTSIKSWQERIDYANNDKFITDIKDEMEFAEKADEVLSELKRINEFYQSRMNGLPKETAGRNEKVKILRQIKDGLTAEERALPKNEREALIRLRFYRAMSEISTAAGKIMERIEDYARKNPDATYEEILQEARRYGFDDLPSSARQKMKIAILRFECKRKLIVTSLQGLSPAELFRAVFGFKPYGEISLDASSPFTIHFNVSDIDAFRAHSEDVVITEKSALEEFLKENPLRFGGFHQPEAGLLSPLAGLIDIGRSGYSPTESGRIFRHEERHALHDLFFSLGERDAQMYQYLVRANKARDALYLKQKEFDGGPQFVELMKEEFPRILDQYRKGFLQRGKDEIMAYLRDTSDRTEASLLEKLLKTGEEALYDYPAKARRDILEGWVPAGAKIRERMYAQIRAQYRREISHAIMFATDLLGTAKTPEERQALLAELSTTPVESWDAVFEERIPWAKMQKTVMAGTLGQKISHLRGIFSNDQGVPLDHFNEWFGSVGRIFSESEMLDLVHQFDVVETMKIAVMADVNDIRKEIETDPENIYGYRERCLSRVRNLLNDLPPSVAEELTAQLLPLVEDIEDLEFREMLDWELRLIDDQPKVTQLADLNFGKMKLETVKREDSPDPTKVSILDSTAELDIVYNGRKLKVKVDKKVKLNVGGEVGAVVYLFNFEEHGKPVLKGSLGMRRKSTDPDRFGVSSSIEKDESVKDDPGLAGLGMAVYGKLLDLVAFHAEKLPIVHTVSQLHDLGLSEADWDRIFSPILSARGYVKMDGMSNVWQRDYSPETLNIEKDEDPFAGNSASVDVNDEGVQMAIAKIHPDLAGCVGLQGEELLSFVNDFNGRHPSGVSADPFVPVYSDGQIVLAFDEHGMLVPFDSIASINIGRDERYARYFPERDRFRAVANDDLDAIRRDGAIDDTIISIRLEPKENIVQIPNIRIDEAIHAEALALVDEGLNSLYFTGTNSAALQGIGADSAILASSRIEHKLRTGERSSQGGRHLQDNVYAGRGHDGLATALTYAYGRESFLGLDHLDVPTLEKMIEHLDILQGNISRLNMDDCMRILDPNNDLPMKVSTVEEARMHVVERLQEWKENIYFRIVSESVPTERRFPVLFGFSGKNHPYFIEPIASREYGSMLSGEVKMGPEVSLRGSGLTDIFVPRAHFNDARTFIENAGLSPDTVKIHSIEALTYALRYGDTTAARVLTETVGGVHLANAERQAASLREALNINP